MPSSPDDPKGIAGEPQEVESRLERSRGAWKRRLRMGLLLAAFAVVPAAIAQLAAPAPRDRRIHVESFRYGKEPSVIRCNRGDTIHLTFSTRDTGHSFFLEEFDLDAKVSPGSRVVEVFRTSRPQDRLGPPREEVSFRAEHPGLLRYLVSKSQFRCHVWCGPMHAFEHGNLIIEPNTLLYAALGLLAGIPVAGLLTLKRAAARKNPAAAPESSRERGWDILKNLPWLRDLMKRRGFQFAFVAAGMAPLYFAILACLLGTHVAGRNLGVLLIWVVWLFLLTAVFTPLGGRIWCLACPLPFIGETFQRGTVLGVRTGSREDSRNEFLGLGRKWPRWLTSSCPRTLAFLTLGTFSTMLVAEPRVSGGVIAGMVVVAAVLSLVWKGRAFCRHVCPINSFLSLYSKAGRLSLRTDDPAVCAGCKPRSCVLGSNKGWGCPYGLDVGDLRNPNECGLCTECIKTCPYDNVTIAWRGFGQDTRVAGAGEAWLSMAMLVVATSYCLVHLGHWPQVRDWVNTLDKGNWHLFARFAAGLWALALVVFPGILFILAAAGKKLAGIRERPFEILKASTAALIPLGLMVWIAFVVPMLFVHVSFVEQSLSDPFGWGWHLLGDSEIPWHQFLPRAVPWIQVACVLAGLHFGLRSAWRVWSRLAPSAGSALRGMAPLAALITAYCGWLLFFFAD